MKRLWLYMFCGALLAQGPANRTWRFAVSGDSRNCGDIVMPAIASGVVHDGAAFYWHLGDFRAIYKFDEDMSPPPQLAGFCSAFFLVDVTALRLGTLARMFDSGKLTVGVGTVLPLDEARTAHEMLAGAPHKRGKIVLTTDGV